MDRTDKIGKEIFQVLVTNKATFAEARESLDSAINKLTGALYAEMDEKENKKVADFIDWDEAYIESKIIERRKAMKNKDYEQASKAVRALSEKGVTLVEIAEGVNWYLEEWRGTE